MKITTLNDLAQFINANEDYNNTIVEKAIENNGWQVIDTENTDFVCHDFFEKVVLGENGAEVLPFIDEDGHEYLYNGHKVVIRVFMQDDVSYYGIDFRTGCGEGVYPCATFSIKEALYDQTHIFDENVAPYDADKDNSTIIAL